MRMAKSAHIDPIEKVTLKTGKLFVTLESGVGAMTTPLIFIDTSVNAEVGNWTKQVRTEASSGVVYYLHSAFIYCSFMFLAL